MKSFQYWSRRNDPNEAESAIRPLNECFIYKIKCFQNWSNKTDDNEGDKAKDFVQVLMVKYLRKHLIQVVKQYREQVKFVIRNKENAENRLLFVMTFDLYDNNRKVNP